MITVSQMLKWLNEEIDEIGQMVDDFTNHERTSLPSGWNIRLEYLTAIRKVVECHTACDGQKPGEIT
jgi:nitrogen fixation/metabolism regulation signal transduction histidine kinase